MPPDQILARLQQIGAKFAEQRDARLVRTHLDRADFDLLAEAGFLNTGLAAKDGGLWVDVRSSAFSARPGALPIISYLRCPGRNRFLYPAAARLNLRQVFNIHIKSP